MTTFVIPADHPSLPGHFPGRPLVPGVVLLERVIEAVESDCRALAVAPPQGSWRLPQVKFLQPLLPGETARIELERSGAGNSGPGDPDQSDLRWRFRVLRETTVLASGEVARPAPVPNPVETPPEAKQ